MNKFETFQQFLTTQSVQVPVLSFAVNLLLASTLAFILGVLYNRYGMSLSNRKMFAKNFILLTAATVLIISIVKSSLALSLGLVGALSIVRFRSAIKEPEELVYLFLAIGIGLGFGADQGIITIVAFILISSLIWLRYHVYKSDNHHNLYLTLASSEPKQVGLHNIIEVLMQYCDSARLKRYDENNDLLEASFLVEFNNVDQLQTVKSKLQELDESLRISYLDNRGI